MKEPRVPRPNKSTCGFLVNTGTFLVCLLRPEGGSCLSICAGSETCFAGGLARALYARQQVDRVVKLTVPDGLFARAAVHFEAQAARYEKADDEMASLSRAANDEEEAAMTFRALAGAMKGESDAPAES